MNAVLMFGCAGFFALMALAGGGGVGSAFAMVLAGTAFLAACVMSVADLLLWRRRRRPSKPDLPYPFGNGPFI